MAIIDNLVSYWNLQANSTDSVGGNNGTDSNISYTDSGTIGYAAEFNGSNSQINFGTDASLDLTGGGSIALWFDTDINNSGYRCLFEKGAKNTSYQVFQNADYNPSRIAGRSKVSPDSAITDPSNIATATGYFVVYTFENGNMDLYVNGTIVASGTGAHTTNTDALCAGFPLSGGSATNHFDGHINRAGIWSRILAQTDVDYLWNGGAGRTYPFPVTTNSNFFNFF